MPCPQPDDPTPSGAPIATDTPTICVRCKANPAIAFFRDSIYCQPCAGAVFYQKSKTGLEYARGAGLAKYVAAAKASSASESSQEASSSTSTPPAAKGDKRNGKQVNNGGGNAEVNVSANIAVAFSGGASSRALLRTATQYFRPEAAFTNRDARRRKARGEELEDDAASMTSAKTRGAVNAAGRFNEVGKIYVLYIDDSAIIAGGMDRTEEARRMVEEEVCADLEFVGLKMEDVFRADDDVVEGVAWKLAGADGQQISTSTATIPDSTQALKDLFSSLHPSDTPRTGVSSARTRIEDLHRILISTLLRRTATRLDCSALLLGDTATRISIRLIEDLAKGAGHKLPIQGSDAAWIDDLLLVRPFKSHLLQEVLFYASALGLEAIQPEQNVVPPVVSTSDILNNSSDVTPVMDKSSIARLTETFILNLEKGVPSTVTTIGKTGSKLVLNDTSPSSLAHDVSSSTAAFQNVGPSVPLRTTARKALHTSMSDLTVNSKEPRIGSRGIKLAQLSASCLRWSTGNGCALCGMPCQKGARWWKRDITISRLDETEPRSDVPRGTASEEPEEGWMDLSSHLCYACLLVLAPPTSTNESLLPSTVLRHIQQSHLPDTETHFDANGFSSALDQDTLETPATSTGCGNHNQPKSTPQPLKPSEIKAQINEFLLDDA